MYRYVFDTQIQHPEILDYPEIRFLKERYYKGICEVPKNKPKQFCNTEFLTWTEATVYAPSILLILLYGPTIGILSLKYMTKNIVLISY